MPDWMRLGFDPWPLMCTFQSLRKEGCKGKRNEFKFASSELPAVLPTAELVFKQESTYCGKGKEENV